MTPLLFACLCIKTDATAALVSRLHNYAMMTKPMEGKPRNITQAAAPPEVQIKGVAYGICDDQGVHVTMKCLLAVRAEITK